MTTGGHSDEQALAAVRGGDAERYRELVERYERRVYGVAWSWLGDPTLAEEATQETFIRGYQRLWLLEDGAKFAGWITTIARRVAINLGLRNRRELKKRERWALEQAGPSGSPSPEASEICPPETMRQTLGELPAAHRECLVLFYLEGKSGAEATAPLGVAESAFRVRLHRARAALRERLEERLAKSLEDLRPQRPVAPSVMGAVLASPSAGAAGAGLGVKLLSVLGKSLPFMFANLLFGLVMMAPSVLLGSWLSRAERLNYREADGFRARLHHDFVRTRLWAVPLIMLGLWLLVPVAHSMLGMNVFFLVLGGFTLVVGGFAARGLRINRNRFQVGMFVYVLIQAVGLLAIGLYWLPLSGVGLVIMGGMLAMASVYGSRPLRMDYSLFLRAAQGMLADTAPQVRAEAASRFDRAALLVFARFLGERWLVGNFGWERAGLALRLPPVRTTFFASMATFFVSFPRGCSRITLGWDGAVTAYCGDKDGVALPASSGEPDSSTAELELQVARAVEEAWKHFRQGNVALAERTLGQVPEADVFNVPTSRSAATRRWRWILVGLVVVLLLFQVLLRWNPPSLSGLRPVAVTEPEIRRALAGLAKDPSAKSSLGENWSWGLDFNFVLPPTNLFTPEALQALRRNLFARAGFDPSGDSEVRLSDVRDRFELSKAMAGGWIGWDQVRLTPEQVRERLPGLISRDNAPAFELARRLCPVDGTDFTVLSLDSFALARLRVLHSANCLDLLPREQLIEQICSTQVLSGSTRPDQPPIHEWRSVRGLFFTPNWPALQDTYCNLAALELLGGLNRIDREACIRAILKRHRGRGYFTPPEQGGYNAFKILGDARDTFCAFESLRILGALDRVRDLDRWQFRPEHASKVDAAAGSPSKVTWEEIEAWVCQERLAGILRWHKDHPQASLGSLLEP